MKHNAFDNEILEAFADIMTEQQLLDKPAIYDVPEGMFGQIEAPLDLSIQAAFSYGPELTSIAASSERTKLYDVSGEDGEDLVHDAHPKGGFHTQLDHKPKDDLCKVETIVEQHKYNEGVARKTPTGKIAALAEKLMVLAAVMDEQGFGENADQIDRLISKLVEQVQVEKIAAGYDPAQKKAMDDAEEHRRQLGLVRKEIQDETGADVGFTPESGEMPEGSLDSQHQKESVVERGLSHLNQQQSAPTDELAALQHKLNLGLSGAGHKGICVDGKWGPQTEAALKFFGVQPGSYHNWHQLEGLIDRALRMRQSAHLAEPVEIGRRAPEAGQFVGVEHAVPSRPPHYQGRSGPAVAPTL